MPLFDTIHPIFHALLATMVTWAFTALGASLVLVTRNARKTAMDAMLALGAGVMLASAFWSLLRPGAELANELQQCTWLIISGGFFIGAMLPEIGERLLSRTEATDSARRTRQVVTAITLHNIPEGLAVGMAFGAYMAGVGTLQGAWMLALGVAVQNFPEGAAVSLPLRREGHSVRKSMFLGQLSGAVEPIAGVLGALLASQVRTLLPFALAFAAGAMVAVAATELIPESQQGGKRALTTAMMAAGFALMTTLDIALG